MINLIENKKKCQKIKILMTDVDGVLTDGGMYYSKDWDIMKKFHARDGMGVNLLRKKGILCLIITKENHPAVKKWASKMKITKLYSGIQKKEDIIQEICKKFKVSISQLAYIGDDVNDLNLIKLVGFSAAPNDAISILKKNSHYVCKKSGGEGVLREVADLILQSQFPLQKNFY